MAGVQQMKVANTHVKLTKELYFKTLSLKLSSFRSMSLLDKVDLLHNKFSFVLKITKKYGPVALL